MAAEYRGARFTDQHDLAGRDADFSLGRLVRGMVTGRWDDAEIEQRALANSTNAAGGFLSPEPLANYVLDRVRNKMRTVEAGATTVPMGADTFAIPRLAGGVTPGWRNENAAVAESDAVFERVTFTARTVAVMQRISYELVQDMTPRGADLVENELIQALAVEIDRVALRGSGTAPEPRGVRNQTGVTVLTNAANGAAATYDMLVRGQSTVAANGFEPGAILANARLTPVARRAQGHDRPVPGAAVVHHQLADPRHRPGPHQHHDRDLDGHQRELPRPVGSAADRVPPADRDPGAAHRRHRRDGRAQVLERALHRHDAGRAARVRPGRHPARAPEAFAVQTGVRA